METDNKPETIGTTALLNSVRQLVVTSNQERGTGATEEGWLAFTIGNARFGYSVANGIQANISRFEIDESIADYEVIINILGDTTITKIVDDIPVGYLDHTDPSFNIILSYLNSLIKGYNISN